MAAKLNDADRRYLRQAVELSHGYREDQRHGPFGAIVVVDGEVAARGVNQVLELHDPTAHAEVMALRSACRMLGRDLLEGGVLYSSSEPCPMCLAACYWACIGRIVYAATSNDVADNGLRDLEIYNELSLPAGARSIQEDTGEGDLRREAIAVLRDWRERYRGLGRLERSDSPPAPCVRQPPPNQVRTRSSGRPAWNFSGLNRWYSGQIALGRCGRLCDVLHFMTDIATISDNFRFGGRP